MEAAGADSEQGDISPRHLLYSLVGWGLQAVFGVLAFASGLVAPPGGVAVIIVVWAATAIYSLVGWRRTPWIPLGMGLLSGALVVAIIAFGGAVLGWNA